MIIQIELLIYFTLIYERDHRLGYVTIKSMSVNKIYPVVRIVTFQPLEQVAQHKNTVFITSINEVLSSMTIIKLLFFLLSIAKKLCAMKLFSRAYSLILFINFYCKVDYNCSWITITRKIISGYFLCYLKQLFNQN